MSHALPALPQTIDPKRVAATSATIALHLAVVMLLLAPPSIQPAPEVVPPPIVVDWTKPKPPPPMPPPPPDQPVRRVVQEAPPQIVQHVEPPPVIFETTSAMATIAPEIIAPPSEIIAPPPSGPMTLQVLQGPAPPYPRSELMAGISGRVVLRIEVDAGGRPLSGTIERSSGSRILDRAALKFVLAKWLFKPAEYNGQPIAATALVPVDYVLQ
jgi:protein TonB